MKYEDYFTAFLDKEVNLNDTRINRLRKHVRSVTDFLSDSDTFRDHFVDVVHQGSFAHKTIIKPVQPEDEFDADILLQLKEVEGWEPRDYIANLHACFSSSGTYKDKVKWRTRCVKLNYTGDFHMDVVPYLERSGKTYITNRKMNEFQLTYPEDFNAWLVERDRITGGNLVRVIRLIKYLRDYKETFSVKSIILTTLLGEQVSEAVLPISPTAYEDVSATLRTVMNRLSTYVRTRPILPTIWDPGGTWEDFGNRWDQQKYANFRDRIMSYATKIDDAYTDTDGDRSLRKWREVFGSEFRAPTKVATEAALTRYGAVVRPWRNTEQQLVDLGIREEIDRKYRLRIEGKTVAGPRFGAKLLARMGNDVYIGRYIRFQIAACTVPEPYDIYWKVRNAGDVAQMRDCIRGEIIKGGREWRQEHSDFAGPHYVECYIVKDRVCVAKDRQPVHIL